MIDHDSFMDNCGHVFANTVRSAFRKVSIPPASKGFKLVNYREFIHFEGVNFRADISSQPWDVLREFFILMKCG